MKFKYLLCVIAIVAITKNTYAQYAQDALRFSTFQPGGTSRIKALGNAGTAVGGDLSSISNNPAGLGFFTHSEFSITPEFNGSKVNSNYFGTTQQASKNQVNLSNAALVLYGKLNTPKGADKTKGWLSFNFGVAYNRTNNFYQNTSYGGKNPNTSIVNYFAQLANNANATPANLSGLEGAAYDQFLIDRPTGSTTTYKSNALPGVNQQKNTYSNGGQSQIDLSFGTNYSNKLYLGFGIGITDIRYNTSSDFFESGTAGVFENNAVVNRTYNSTYTQDQVTRGTGFNAKFGIIYKAAEAIRLGASITTPTWSNIDDVYSEGLSTRLSNNNGGTYGPEDYAFNYNLRTPFKAAGGISVFLGTVGFITGDVEYQDYSSIHLSTSNNSGTSQSFFNADNNDINTLYRSVVNAHVGAEIKADQLYIRGGYGVQGNPLKQYGGNINTVSGGLGYRFGSYYIDATYTHVQGNSTVFPYELTTGTNYGANLKNSLDNVFLTLGFRL